MTTSVLDLRAAKRHNMTDAMSEQAHPQLRRIELRVLRQVRSGYARDFMSPDVREKLKSMGLIEEVDAGPVITD